jgi:DNA-binding transcriptional regulator/RsmH inhibitor MraZ
VGLFVVQLPPDIVSDLKDKSLYITIWQDSSLMLFTEDQWQEQKKHLKQLIEEEPAKERAYTKLILNSARTLLLKENAVAIPDHMLHHVGETDNLSVTATPSGIQISSSRN